MNAALKIFPVLAFFTFLMLLSALADRITQ